MTDISDNSDVNINQVIAGGSKRVSLADLAKQGHAHVRAIDEDKLKSLILRAVNAVVSKRLSDQNTREELLKRQREISTAQDQIEARENKLKGDLSSEEREQLEKEVSHYRKAAKQREQFIAQQENALAEASRAELQKLMAETQKEIAEKNELLAQIQDLKFKLTSADHDRQIAQKEMDSIKDGVGDKKAFAKLQGGMIKMIALAPSQNEDGQDLPEIDIGNLTSLAAMSDLVQELLTRFRMWNIQMKMSASGMGGANLDEIVAEIRQQLPREYSQLIDQAGDHRQGLTYALQKIAGDLGRVTELKDLVQRLGSAKDEAMSIMRESQMDIARYETMKMDKDAAFEKLKAERDAISGKIAQLEREKYTFEAENKRLESENKDLANKVSTMSYEHEKQLESRLGELNAQMEAIKNKSSGNADEIARQVAWAIQSGHADTKIDTNAYMDQIFQTQLESNVQAVEAKKVKSKGASKALKALKNFKLGGIKKDDGGDAPPAEGEPGK
ncbi:MAG: hypothetical protein ACREJ2_15410 [Planctomycetota bacterium]